MKWSLICTLAVVAARAQPRFEVVGTLQGNGNVQAAAMAVDRSGNMHLAGSTNSSQLATAGAYQTKTGSTSLYRYMGAGAPLPPLHPRSRVDRAAVKFRPQAGKDVLARAGGDDGARRPGADLDGLHRGARHHAAGAIGNHPDDLTGLVAAQLHRQHTKRTTWKTIRPSIQSPFAAFFG